MYVRPKVLFYFQNCKGIVRKTGCKGIGVMLVRISYTYLVLVPVLAALQAIRGGFPQQSTSESPTSHCLRIITVISLTASHIKAIHRQHGAP